MSVRCYPLGSGKAVRNHQIQTLIYIIQQNLRERTRSLKIIVKALLGLNSEVCQLPSVEKMEMILALPNMTTDVKLKLKDLFTRAEVLVKEATEIRQELLKESLKLQRDIIIGIPRGAVLTNITGRGLKILRKKWERKNSLMSYVPMVKRLEKKWALLQLQTELKTICGGTFPWVTDAQTQTGLENENEI
ncbi:hypothetical protein Ocin01_11451 [Orchesella cincta]|uniref:Uncharacterized protein n=1 Tax=Orchesella cincta TaxID=48709 RepID=A0A1D2MQ47_ORCCI|nr:hypothetical protein Ocin01_11451 [Orchesella cincta]